MISTRKTPERPATGGMPRSRSVSGVGGRVVGGSWLGEAAARRAPERAFHLVVLPRPFPRISRSTCALGSGERY